MGEERPDCCRHEPNSVHDPDSAGIVIHQQRRDALTQDAADRPGHAQQSGGYRPLLVSEPVERDKVF